MLIAGVYVQGENFLCLAIVCRALILTECSVSFFEIRHCFPSTFLIRHKQGIVIATTICCGLVVQDVLKITVLHTDVKKRCF